MDGGGRRRPRRRPAADLAAADRHEASGQRLPALHALVDHVRVGGHRASSDRVAALAGQVEGRSPRPWPTYVGHLRAGASRPGWRPPATPSRRSASTCSPPRPSPPPPSAGSGWATSGPRPAADRRAATALGRCEGRPPPAPGAAPGRSSARREHEVARLAADGLTNKAIADRLVLSVRTVETLLQRSYQKLGIERRADLAATLGEPD